MSLARFVSKLGQWRRRLWRRGRRGSLGQEVDALYAFLHRLVHDLENPLPLASRQTREAFAHQWQTHKEGHFLLSDPWFKANVARILCEEELLLRPEWFPGREVLDAGCGNGRWSYGFAQLGCRLTAVDVNKVALDETRDALRTFSMPKELHVSALEDVGRLFAGRRFDLVFSWGVLHHCGNFVKALRDLAGLVKADGVLYLYLYGRESLDWARDLELFKQRLYYHTLPGPEAQRRFLLDLAGGDEKGIHNAHDIYAPLINRRLDWDIVRSQLRDLGFADVERTVDHSELFIRAFRAPRQHYEPWLLPAAKPPYWFQRAA